MARFVQIIEFQTSRIEEIEALGRPSGTGTSDFAARMAALCAGPPAYRNPDVMREDTGSPTDVS